MGDVNGDGRLDVLTANGYFGSNSGDVSVVLGNGDGTFQAQQRFAVGGSPTSVAVADVNGDGRLDLVTADGSYYSGGVSVLLGNGDGTFQAEQRFAVGAGPSSVAVADVNGDRRLDVLTANSYTNDVSVLLGAGDGTFQAQPRFAVGAGPLSVAVGDVNEDGWLDVVTTNLYSDNVSVLLHQ